MVRALKVRTSYLNQVSTVVKDQILCRSKSRFIICSDAYLSELLNKIETTFSNTIVFYTGSVSRTLHERQELDEETKPFSFLAPQGDGILSRYQILTPGLIISLALGFFLLLPIVLLSIKALASVQSSVRLDVPKPTGQDKKNQ